MPAVFIVNDLPVTTLLTPNDASGRLAKMVYPAGSGWASPRMEVAWTYSAPEGGQPQTKYELEIAPSTTPTVSTGAPGATIVSGEVSSAATAATPAPSSPYVEGNFYFVRVRVFDGLEWSAWSGWFQCRVRWGLTTHIKDTGGVPTAWSVSGLHTTEPANTDIVLEYNSRTGVGTPTDPWQADLATVTKRTHVFYRAWFFAWGNSPVATASLDDITIQWSSFAMEPDFWKPSPISGVGGSIEAGKFVFGTQSLKMVGNGTERIIRQKVRLEPGQDYTLQGRIESVGDSGASVRLSDTDTGAAVGATSPLVATDPFGLRLAVPWNSGTRTAIWVQTRISGAVGTAAFFDGIKLEKGRVASTWTPTYIGSTFDPSGNPYSGSAGVVDGGGVQVDASQGGIVRLRGSTGAARDVTELGAHGLKTGGPTGPIEVYSDAAGSLKIASVPAAATYLGIHGGADAGYTAMMAGDTVSRMALVGSSLGFGSGSAARDVEISREGVNTWRVGAGDWFAHDLLGCWVYRASAQSIPASAWTAMQFNSADQSDRWAMHDPASNNTRIVIPRSGMYHMVFNTGLEAITASRSIIGIGINGAAPINSMHHTNAVISGTGMGLHFVALRYMTAGQYVEAMLWHGHASAVNSYAENLFGVYYIGEL